MKNQLQMKAATLAEILDKNRLTKAASQTITHKSLLDQTNLGKEQTDDVANATQGVLASTDEAANHSKEKVREIPNAQSLNTSGEAAIRAGGRKIKTQTEDGDASGTPAEQAKVASYYRKRLAQIRQNKQASQKEVVTGVNMDDFRTGSEVLEKVASLVHRATNQDLWEAEDALIKLAATNPLFNVCKERILMNKMAQDIKDLAEAEGISEEEAAANLQEAAEANPEMLAEIDEEATGEALVDLADAEAETAEFIRGLEEMAAHASEVTGEVVTPDDLIAAADEVAAMAEATGVPAEALIAQAVEEMQGGEEPTEEDMMEAEAILEEAAAMGVSPEEVIEAVLAESDAEGMEGGEEPTEEDRMEAEAILAEAAEMGVSPEEVIEMALADLESGDEEVPVEKVASLQKRAGSPRAAFVQQLRHRRDGR
jgi:hypothetical protein